MAEMDIVPYIGTRTPADFDTLFDELEAARGSSASLSDAIAEKADNATTLSGYGITDAYTKTEIDTALSGKQNELSQSQLDAANSGITAEKLTADEADITSVKHMVDPRSQSQVSGGNLDNITVSEMRVYSSPSGLPTGVSASSVCIAETCVVDSNSAYQIITLLSNQGTAQDRSYPTYKRVKVGGVWYDWKLIIS